jgi:hypothetical protein
VEPEGLGVELVRKRLALRDGGRPDARHAVTAGGVDAMEVDRVRVVGAVDEADPQPLSLARTQRRPGHAPVVGPGGVLHTGRHLDLLVLGHELPLAHAAHDPALVEVAQDLLRVEAVRARVDRPNGADVVAPVVRAGATPLVLCRGRIGAVDALVRDHLVQHRNSRACGRRAPEQTPPGKFALP